MAFYPNSRRYFELQYKEAEAFAKSGGDIKKLVDSRMERFGKVEPSLDEIQEMKMVKNLAEQRNVDSNDKKTKEDTKNWLEKFKQ